MGGFGPDAFSQVSGAGSDRSGSTTFGNSDSEPVVSNNDGSPSIGAGPHAVERAANHSPTPARVQGQHQEQPLPFNEHLSFKDAIAFAREEAARDGDSVGLGELVPRGEVGHGGRHAAIASEGGATGNGRGWQKAGGAVAQISGNRAAARSIPGHA